MRRRECIAVTPPYAERMLQELIGIQPSPIESVTVEDWNSIAAAVAENTGSNVQPLVASSGLSTQYAIMMGLLNHARQTYPGKPIQFLIPPNCYGGTNDQARISLGALANNPPYNRGVNLVGLNNGNGHDFVVQCSASHGAGPSEKLRIDSAGRCIVGGGTHAGGSALVVKGGNQNTYSTIGMFSNHTNPSDDTLLSQIRFGSNTTAVGADIRAEADADWGTNDYPTRISFYTTPDSSNSRSERMRISKDGKIGLNNTSPAYTLDVAYSGNNASNAAVSRFRQTFNNQGDDHTCFIVRHAAARSGQNGVGLLFQNNGGTAVGKIDFGHSTTQYRTSSDYRLKENAVSISDGISRLKTLKPYRFNWIAEKDQPKVDGFFAHEVTAVPESISGTKDEVDSDNNPVYQSIDHSKLVPLLTAALQEAITKIETLEAKVTALEGS